MTGEGRILGIQVSKTMDVGCNVVYKREKILKLLNNLEFHVPSPKMWRATLFIIREIFKKQRYQKTGFEIKQTDTIIDIGAHMGLFVMWIAPQTSKGKIIAVEPTKNINVLNTNLAKNNIKNVKTIKAAVGLDGSYIELVTYPNFNVINHQTSQKPTFLTQMIFYLLSGQWRWERNIEKVPTISLGKIIDDAGLKQVDFLKIDCEGCEFDIFRNLSDEYFNRIEKIVMEFHEYHPSNKYEELVSILENKGYNVIIEKPLIDYYLVGKCGFIWARRD